MTQHHRRIEGFIGAAVAVGIVAACSSMTSTVEAETPQTPKGDSKASSVADPAAVPTGGPSALLVDDFDDGEKPNMLGGDFGSWNKDGADPTQSCSISFDKEHTYSGRGYVLRLDYDVDSPNPAYNGFWTELKGADLRPYRTLSFSIMGDGAKGYTTRLKLELKTAQETGSYLLKGVTDQWHRASIPLKRFAGLKDVSKVTELVFTFEDITATKKVGTIYLDDLAFE